MNMWAGFSDKIVSVNPAVSPEATLTTEENYFGSSVERIVSVPYDYHKELAYVDLSALRPGSLSQHDLKNVAVKAVAKLSDETTDLFVNKIEAKVKAETYSKINDSLKKPYAIDDFEIYYPPGHEVCLPPEQIPPRETTEQYNGKSGRVESLYKNDTLLQRYSIDQPSLTESTSMNPEGNKFIRFFSQFNNLYSINESEGCNPTAQTPTMQNLVQPYSKNSRTESLLNNTPPVQRHLIKRPSSIMVASTKVKDDKLTPLTSLIKVNLECALDKIIALKYELHEGFNPPKTGYEKSRTDNEGSAGFMLDSAKFWLKSNSGNKIYTKTEISSFEDKLARAKAANEFSAKLLQQYESINKQQ